MLKLNSEVEELAGVGETVAKKLNKLGIKTVKDLIFYYPRRYEDFSKITPIAKLKPGQVTIQGQILRAVTRRTRRRGFTITEAVIDDGTGGVKATWFNQPYLAGTLPKEEPIYASGKLEFKYGQYSLLGPAIERVSSFPKDTARIVPIYGETKGLTSKQIRGFIKQALPLVTQISDIIPSLSYAQGQALETRQEALRQVHFPESTAKLEQAKHSLAFEELFVLILTGLVIKSEIKTEASPVIKMNEKLARDFVKSLKFKLTDAQRKAAWRILQDIDSDTPMNRLLEGDVGSGKTVVALMAALMAIDSGYQVALLAPTEILAAQHHKTIENLNVNILRGRIKYLHGGMEGKEREQARAVIEEGKADLIIGTHALIQEDVTFKNLGLVIIDEQHRFGVNQRNNLKAKAKAMPHLLTMSATPIPRSLALTVYGDLDISVIDELPPGRKPVVTKLAKEGDRQKVYFAIEDQIKKGHQVYVICPLISESDKLGVKSVEAEAERLKAGPFNKYRIAVLHGRLKSEEKEKIMQDFVEGRVDILVSTTVVEVGVDVPNATVMLVEGAERFGLAQLHQLRGRVGRADHQSDCYLIASKDRQAQYRLEVLEKYNDGFTLAQKDLEIRGPGQIYGQMQHGILDLRMADLSDTKLISQAREAAEKFLDRGDLSKYPRLLDEVNKLKTVTRLD